VSTEVSPDQPQKDPFGLAEGEQSNNQEEEEGGGNVLTMIRLKRMEKLLNEVDQMNETFEAHSPSKRKLNYKHEDFSSRFMEETRDWLTEDAKDELETISLGLLDSVPMLKIMNIAVDLMGPHNFAESFFSLKTKSQPFKLSTTVLLN
jgi:hypothetical protein